jgi:PAS domain S-box-containing protein
MGSGLSLVCLRFSATARRELIVITAAPEAAEQEQTVQDVQLLAAIVQYSENAIIGSTIEGRILSWNPAAERLYGYTGEEVVGRSGRLLVPRDRAHEFLTAVARVKDGNAVEHFETMRARKDGSLVPVSLTVAPIHDGDGVIVGASAVHRDATEQRRAFEVAQRMEAIVQDSDDAILGRTLQDIITSWNPAAERMFGYSGKDMIGRSVDLLIPEDRMAQSAAMVAEIAAGHQVGRVVTDRVRKDGTAFAASITLSPIRDIDAVIVGASAIIRDITLEKRAVEVAQRMEAIVQSSDDAIMAVTLEGIVTSWNPAAERLFGYTCQEIIGTSAEVVVPSNRPDETKDILAKVRAGQHLDHLETTRVRRDGTMLPVSLTISPIYGVDGAIVGASMITRDMTALRHAVRYARSLIEAGLDPLVTINLAGQITDVNEATIEVTGVPRERLVGTDFSRYFTNPGKAEEGYRQAFEKGSLTDYPLTLVHENGALTDLLYNASVYRDFNDNVLGVLALGRDAARLREQQQLSEQLQAALESRIILEQAKGITAQRHGVTIDEAHRLMRAHARNNNATLRVVAEAIVAVGLAV